MLDSLLLVPGTMCDQRLWQPMLQTAAGQQLQQLMTMQHAAIWQQSDRSGMLATIAAPQAAHLIGFSMGGYLALSYVLTQPLTETSNELPTEQVIKQPIKLSTKLQQVKSLVMIAASAAPLPDVELQGRQQALQWLSRHRYQGMSRKRLAEFVHPDQLDNPLVTAPILTMDRELGHDVLYTQLSHTSDRPSLLEQLAKIRCPVLLIAGRDDRLVDVAQLEYMAKILPDAQLALLPDCGHMLPLEQPAVLASALLAFYQRFVESANI